MYMPSTHTTEVNTPRYELFCVKLGEVESSQLPPCQDCLFMHALVSPVPTTKLQSGGDRCRTSPTFQAQKTGWTTYEDGKLAVKWMHDSPAPDAVLELLACKCVRSCKLPQCTCLSNGLKYTDMCRLQTCAQQPSQRYQVMFVNMSRLTIHVQAENELCVQVRYLLGSN